VLLLGKGEWNVDGSGSNQHWLMLIEAMHLGAVKVCHERNRSTFDSANDNFEFVELLGIPCFVSRV
jgi:hypothetical protein